MSNSLKRTPLYDLHVAAGARLVEFGGWEMPLQYQGLVAEHKAVRSQAGMFDVSHMGKFAIAGVGVLETLNKLVPSNLGRLKVGQALYTVLLNEQNAPKSFLLVPNEPNQLLIGGYELIFALTDESMIDLFDTSQRTAPAMLVNSQTVAQIEPMLRRRRVRS